MESGVVAWKETATGAKLNFVIYFWIHAMGV